MVAFNLVIAEISHQISNIIPGDETSKIVYLKDELQEQYPSLSISQCELSKAIKFEGMWHDIVDLHDMLDEWCISVLSNAQNICGVNGRVGKGLTSANGCSNLEVVNDFSDILSGETGLSSLVNTVQQFTDIKSFSKSWHGRKKDKQIQTDGAESECKNQRRVRKPRTPRKVKAHVPLKHEHEENDTVQEPAAQAPKKKKRGRPRKKSVKVDLQQDNVALDTPDPSRIWDNSTHIVSIDAVVKPKESLLNEENSPFVPCDPDVPVVIPTAPVEQRSAKTRAKAKVEEIAKEESTEISKEKRGRKPKFGPYVSRENIFAYLPVEDKEGPLFCKLCSHATNTKASLKQHFLRCHLERKFQCRICGKKYSLLKELASHKLTHNRNHPCQLCSKRFATQYLLQTHLERKHLNPKKKVKLNPLPESLNCSQCDFIAKSKKSLQDHAERIHGEKTHQCPICNKMFALIKDLNQHVKFHSEVYQCEECGKALKSKLALKLHINGIHRGIKLAQKKEYVCEDCGKICRNKTHFKEHMNKEHLHVKPFQCDICSLSFFTKHALKCHGRVHSDTREFICDLCGKGFKNQSGLRVHRITHQDVTARPYVCTTCNKAFTQRGALVRHERIHSGDRPYKCRLCDSSFNDYSILRRHVVGVHKINDRALCGRVDIDPNAINRGRPKMPMEQGEKSSLNYDSQPKLLDIESCKTAEFYSNVSVNETDTTDLVNPSLHLSQHADIFQMSDHEATSSPLDNNSPMYSTVKICDPQVQVQARPHGQKQYVFSHADVAALSRNQLQSVELVSISGADNQIISNENAQQLHVTSQADLSSYTNMVPISVVSDMVHNVLYEHPSLDGNYTIGMPVFPTPTTVANMHMMQSMTTHLPVDVAQLLHQNVGSEHQNNHTHLQ